MDEPGRFEREPDDDERDDTDDAEGIEPSVSVEITGLSVYTHHGVTEAEREVGQRLVFDVEFEGQGKDAYGKQRAGFTATGAINRLDFGIKWNPALETGGFAVSNRVKLTLHIAAVRQD